MTAPFCLCSQHRPELVFRNHRNAELLCLGKLGACRLSCKDVAGLLRNAAGRLAAIGYDQIKILTDGGPNNATRSLSILIYNDAFKNNRFASAMAEAIIVGIVVAVISYVQLQISNKKSVNA